MRDAAGVQVGADPSYHRNDGDIRVRLLHRCLYSDSILYKHHTRFVDRRVVMLEYWSQNRRRWNEIWDALEGCHNVLVRSQSCGFFSASTHSIRLPIVNLSKFLTRDIDACRNLVIVGPGDRSDSCATLRQDVAVKRRRPRSVKPV